MAKILTNFFSTKSYKYVLRGVSSDQYDSLLNVVRSFKTDVLENHLRFMPTNEARSLVNIQNRKGVSLLMSAVYFTNPGTVDILVKYGADVSLTDDKGQTALFYVISSHNHNQLAILDILLDQNCDLNHQDNFKDMFMHKAIKHEKIDIIRAIVNKNIAFDKRDIDGARAVDTQNAVLIKIILEKDVDVDRADLILGWTALHIAAIHNDVKTVKLLIKKGADIRKQDRQLKSALEYANDLDCVEVAKYLSKRVSK